jgi:hypothetical protein
MTSEHYRFPGRTLVALTTMRGGLVLAAFDLQASGGIDPFNAPSPIALGSGQAPGGAHCSGA